MTILILAVLYFVPTFVAWGRKNHTSAIFALNLFFGWTVIGWVIALVMALWSNHAAPPASVDEPDWKVELRETRDQASRLLRRRNAKTPRPARS